MTELSPNNPLNTTLGTVPMQWFPGRIKPYNNIQPFTYTDGETYLDVQTALRSWLSDQLVPFVNATFEEYVVEFNLALAKLSGYADEFQTYIESEKAVFDGKVDEYNALVAKATADFIKLSNDAMATVKADADRAVTARNQAEVFSATMVRLQDESVSSLIDSLGPLTRTSIAKRFGIYVTDYGAVGDGTTDDTAAIQAALDALDAQGGGKLYLSPGRVYAYSGTLQTPARGVTWEGQGATLRKLYTGTQTSTSIVNKVAENERGYGSSGKGLRFRNIRFVGDYNAGGVLDFSMAFHHVDGIYFHGCTWEQGNVHAHYVDLAGCRYVEFDGSNSMLGANPPVGREYVEAIQIDQSTYVGAGWKGWPRSSFDGLPTKNVTVDGMTFSAISVNGIDYPCPNPIGSHGAALLGDNGYYEDIQFINNRVEGWTRIIAIGAGAAYGWVHFRGVRNLDISNNHFKYTGPSGLSAISAVVNVVGTTQAIADADVALDSPVSQALATTRYSRNVTVNGNKFTGFGNGPTSDDYGLITLNSPVTAVVANNSCDDANSTVVKVSSSGTADAPRISGNAFYSKSDKPVISSVAATMGEVANNVIHLTNAAGTGIREYGSNGTRVTANKIRGGNIGIDVLNTTNTTVDSNTVLSQVNAAIRVGTATASDTAFDTIVYGNRSRSTETGSIGLSIGSKASRTRRFGNFWSTATKVNDQGDGTVNTGYLDND